MLTVADTAFSIAEVRADETELFVDPFAKYFVSAGAHAAEGTKRYLDLPFFREGVRLRTRFIDDFVRDAMRDSAQLVILGAGFDMRAMRLPELEGASVYEIDSPDQMERKRTILDHAGVAIPARVRYVGFDFATDIDRALDETDFRFDENAAFIWEGVIGYIDRTAIDASLRFMARAGTRLVFTSAEATFSPDTSDIATARMGWETCEEIGLDDAWRRYWRTEPYEYARVSRICTCSKKRSGA